MKDIFLDLFYSVGLRLVFILSVALAFREAFYCLIAFFYGDVLGVLNHGAGVIAMPILALTLSFFIKAREG